jgi:hypothetical protein
VRNPKYSKRRSPSPSIAKSSLRALSFTNRAVSSPITPSAWPSATDWLKDATPWLRTSLSTYPASRRAASREYCGSSPIISAAVWIDSRSSSAVVAPSYRPLIVRVATRIGSTSARSPHTRSTARTILLTSTDSLSPFRFRTLMVVRVGASVTVTSLSSRDRS